MSRFHSLMQKGSTIYNDDVKPYDDDVNPYGDDVKTYDHDVNP